MQGVKDIGGDVKNLGRMVQRMVRRSAPGAPPGTVSPPDATAVETHIRTMAYSPAGLSEEEGVGVERCVQLCEGEETVWIDVVGLASTDLLVELRDRFGLHPLVMEDVVNTGQRPKLEEYEDYDFIVVRIVSPEPSEAPEQLSLVLKDNCVMTFQEHRNDSLEPVRTRLRRSMGRIRHAKSDYLAYAVLDAVIDHYVPVLDRYGERIEALEREIIFRPDPVLVAHIYELRHEVEELRRAVRPMLDVVGRLHNEEVPLFSEEVMPYLRDCYDHTVRLVDNVDHQRVLAASLMELHLSSMSQRMNEVMKVLTIISTIFIPLSFVVGLYGMNFDPTVSPWNMPELGWRYGYLFVIGFMVAMVLLQLVYFRRKGWLGGGPKHPPLS
ncbi:magnesium and cobalt transport protein CorA [Haliangium ochraceum DSM 14365]|uniref:Magnesium transport protein CorA n=2 Tax=Haliangium ochraceum TaxID=80816 RepID=D0LGT0_HALO1|nr:magnesium and cobalt transport protein CorA [Haliangium ochraceum DSM 14365]